MEKLIDTIINLIENNKYEEALTECSRFVFLYPLNPIGYELRGDCFLYFKKYELAFINYREAISLTDTKSIKNKINLSLLYKKKGICNLKINNLKEAIDDFTNSINYNSDNYDAYHLRAKTYRKLGKYELALKDANNAIDLFAECAEAYNNRGSIYYLTNKPQEAINDFTKAISIKPEYSGAYYNRSLVYSNLLKDFESAKKDLEKAELYKKKQPQPYIAEGSEEKKETIYEQSMKTYEEKREEFKNLTVENGRKLSEGLFETVESIESNVIDFGENKEQKKEEKSLSDVFTSEKKVIIDSPQAIKGEVEDFVVEDVLEAKHKSENLSTPFSETSDKDQSKSQDVLISEVKIPEEIKTLHEEIVLPPKATRTNQETKDLQITSQIKEDIKTPEKQELVSESKRPFILTKEPTRKEEIKEKSNLSSEKIKFQSKSLNGKQFNEKYKRSYTTLYIGIGVLILVIVLAAIFLFRILQQSKETAQEKKSTDEKRNFIIYEKEDTNKITLKEEFENVMLEKGLVLVAIDDGFKFQAGSFKDSMYAVSRMKWLINQEFEPEMEVSDLKEKGTFYRVRFGEFETVEQADSVARLIK